jgi:hypothetical protein
VEPGEQEILESVRRKYAEARQKSDAANEALVEAQRQASFWEKRAAGLAKAVAGLEEAEAEPAAFQQASKTEAAAATRSQDAPRGQEAVQLILKEQPADWLTAQEIARIAQERGWVGESTNPVEAIRIALKRATRAGHVERGTVNGRMWAYRLRRQDTPSTNGRPSEEVVHEEGLEVGR